MTPIERAARALALSQSGVDEWDALDEAFQETLKEHVRAVLGAIREPTPGMVEAVVQQVGNPSPDQWTLADRVVERIGLVSVNGERACAELVRDWQAMIDTALAEKD